MISIKNVKKQYKNSYALRGISLEIQPGSCLGLVGPNGAGKTTLIKILASIIQDYKGKIQFGETVKPADFKKQIGYVPQEICLEQTVSALSNLYYFGRLYGLKGRELKERAKEVLEIVGLTGHQHQHVLTFSGGMKRRLNIGCALLHQPKIIIMDEPTVGIDPQSRKYIFQLIEKLKQKGCTIIYASHYMEEIEQLCDEVALIDQGKLIENGKLEDLIQKYAVPAVYVKGENCFPENLKQFGTIEHRHGGYVVETNRTLEVMEKVIQFCKLHQRQPEQLKLVQPRLEDVFFSLTGNQLRD